MTFTCTAETWREINAQPDIWADWAAPLADARDDLCAWIKAKGIREVWFAGAGTSAFIGDTLAAVGHPDLVLRAMPTTDLVGAVMDLPKMGDDLLVIQFGRSGNSSESVGTLDMLDAVAPHVHQLNITCNSDSALATRPAPGPGERRVLNLPAATHDVGFAMTSSFTTMLMSALALLDPQVDLTSQIAKLSTAATTLITQLSATVQRRPERAVFLGAGALKGVARESALKVLELTAGETMTQWDSTLGFRHGPKAGVVGDTLVAVMIHPDQHAARYDIDVAKEITAQFPDATVVTIGGAGSDIWFTGTQDARWDAVLYVLVAQIWAVMWSQELDLNIDNPFHSQGNLSRVVTGVTLYPVDLAS
ncbi:phosphosugar isomerase [Loktanella sp. D2R18]|uniref:SIS domain-containing protein n=1 Tax=Rhodobacterales TaxID=204455 RepID=UPI000DE9D499|nr:MULTISPECIES: SIS domain-containing protein [Rhodobacterales]MDO6591901.1 SIS domain-containing protein [Yoonia sp. 1_MG-2023]RBW42668.1 phosphosugar isomerase [Loktanella sp. D2R18]